MLIKEKSNDLFLKRFYYLLVAIYLLSLVTAYYVNISDGKMAALGMTFVATLTPWIVPICFKIFHFKPVYEIYIIALVFTFFASLAGSSFGWYSYFGFDKILHFTSGWLFATVAVILFFYINKRNDFRDEREFKIFLVFVNAVNIAIAEIWEFSEYAMLVFFQNDGINHYSQGVHDTITDVMCATVAGLLFTLLIVRYYTKGKSNFFIHVYEKFFTRNIKHME